MDYHKFKRYLYIALTSALIICIVQLYLLELYPWIQITSLLLAALMTLGIAELNGEPSRKSRFFYLGISIFQLLLAGLVILQKEYVLEYYHLIAYPLLFSITTLPYSIFIRNKNKYAKVFLSLTIATIAILGTRLFFYHNSQDPLVMIGIGIQCIWVSILIPRKKVNE